MIEYPCPCCIEEKRPRSLLAVSKTNAGTGKLSFLCRAKGCDYEEDVTIEEAKIMPGLIASRLCPACAETGKIGRMVRLGIQQWVQGYDKNQTYEYQCLACGELWIEDVVLRAKASQRIPQAMKVGLTLPKESA